MINSILITGATGFLGSHFLMNILGKKVAHAYVIVRGVTAYERQQKLRAALVQANESYLLQAPLDDLEKRITILSGDITQKKCGLNNESIEFLQSKNIHSLWHYAATLSFEEYRKEVISVQNVEGANHCVNLCSTLDVNRFVYVSTAFTCGRGNGQISEQLHSLERTYSNYYEESKNRAEHIVSKICSDKDIKLTILRPSVVIGNSETKKPGGSTTGIYGFLREISKLKRSLKSTKSITRIFGDPIGEVNVIPVDILMKDVASILSSGIDRNEIYHLTYDKNPKTGVAMNTIFDAFGIDNLSFEVRDTSALSPLEELISRRTTFYSNYIDSSKRFSRKLKNDHRMDEEDVKGFIKGGLEDIKRRQSATIFNRKIVKTDDGAYLNVYTTGDETAPPVIIVNAHGMLVDFVTPLAKALKKQHFVITWETRLLPSLVHNSEHVACDTEAHVADLLKIMDVLNIAQCPLAGWCTGALIALEVGRAHSNRVSRLALMNGTYNFRDGPRTEFEENMSFTMPIIAGSRKKAQLYHSAIFASDTEKTSFEEKDAQQRSYSLLSSTDPELIHLTSFPFQSADHVHRYGRLLTEFNKLKLDDTSPMPPQPVLVITGESDQTAHHAHSTRLHSMISRSMFYSTKNGDHFSMYNDPQYIKEICNFVGNRERPELINNKENEFA